MKKSVQVRRDAKTDQNPKQHLNFTGHRSLGCGAERLIEPSGVRAIREVISIQARRGVPVLQMGGFCLIKAVPPTLRDSYLWELVGGRIDDGENPKRQRTRI